MKKRKTMKKQNKNSIKNVLIKARSFIKRGWTRGVYARNKYGHEVDIISKSAIKFCALGAIDKATNSAVSYKMTMDFMDHIIDCSVSSWNDSSTKKQVLEGFDKAIKSLENK